MKRFWSKTRATEDGCLEWTAYRLPGGYGQFRFGGRTRLAHRVAYELEVGPIPEGLTLDHLCRNRACVNPAHLEAVTQAENTRRGDAGKENAAKTRCANGHEFTPDNTRTRRRARGGRLCLACHRDWARQQRARKKESK